MVRLYVSPLAPRKARGRSSPILSPLGAVLTARPVFLTATPCGFCCAGRRLYFLRRPVLVTGGCGNVPLPLHGCVPEHALVGASGLLLHLEQRALAPFGAHGGG